MPVRIKIPARLRSAKHPLSDRLNRILQYSLLAIGALVLLTATFIGFTYNKYARLTDQKLLAGPFPDASILFAAPQVVAVGDPGTPSVFANRLRESNYAEDVRSSPTGWYHLRPDAIEIFPGARSFAGADPGVIKFTSDRISGIISLSDNSARTQYTMEPRLLSSIFDKNREKRRLVHYADIPPVLVHAVISIEDKRFFQHSGFDPIRIVKAVFVDIRDRRKTQGASTLTQQLVKMLWLDSQKTFARKFDELLITIHLESKLTKQQIFEYYANEVDLGRRGSFAIRGFGEAAQAYFGKDMRSLTLPEAATIAGLIQEPSFRNPVRHPERAESRRNVVLKQMRDNGFISQGQYEDAVKAEVSTARQGMESADAPYFVDLVNERLSNDFGDKDFQDSGSRIYTTLDPDLQRDAADAVAIGMKEVSGIQAKRVKAGQPYDEAQVALICIDPHTGEVKALIGGRNYGASQLNHAIAKRPSGSVFKPFVYAAALNTGLQDRPDPLTPSTLIKDEARTFFYGGKPYEPVDFHKGEWLGDVTLRTALAKSLNVPTVEVAEAVGYNTVADLAHKAGLQDIRATPSMALGAYDVTPLEMAGAYTIFANSGVMVSPHFLSRIVDRAGAEVWTSQPATKPVLDPRISFLMDDLMTEVLRTGTGAGVRARGFTLPAAGKTGTSHDAWFAGFTSRLLCIVWVGLDDYQDLKIEGAKAALPIWAEFMRRAHKHRAYRDVQQFTIPDGLVSAQIDLDTGQLATSACPQARTHTEYYLVNTQPVSFCALHSGGTTQIAGWDTGVSAPRPTLPNLSPQPNVLGSQAAVSSAGTIPDPMNPQGNPPPVDTNGRSKEKKGLLDKFKSIFH